MRVSLRVISGGSALLQEMLPQARSDDLSNRDGIDGLLQLSKPVTNFL
jgi:hypothetical protein